MRRQPCLAASAALLLAVGAILVASAPPAAAASAASAPLPAWTTTAPRRLLRQLIADQAALAQSATAQANRAVQRGFSPLNPTAEGLPADTAAATDDDAGGVNDGGTAASGYAPYSSGPAVAVSTVDGGFNSPYVPFLGGAGYYRYGGYPGWGGWGHPGGRWGRG